jgi:hypothetical protein
MNLYTDPSQTSARTHLNDAKRGLIRLMARKRQDRRSAKILKDRVAEYKRCAVDALDKGEESLAGEIAESIATMESQLLVQQKENDAFMVQVNRLKNVVHRLERRVDDREDAFQYLLDYLDASAELQDGGDDLQLRQKMQAAGIGKTISTSGEILTRIRANRIVTPW